MKIIPLYRQIQESLKKQIQESEYKIGDYLPSENDLCTAYKTTRTTARNALDALQKEGFIIRRHGKKSQVRERRESLGLLTVKGFSESVEQRINTDFIQTPTISDWDFNLSFRPSVEEKKSACIYFSRLRYVNEFPAMVEDNWLPEIPEFTEKKFVNDSFFKTLSQRYLIEIIGSEQELRAMRASRFIADFLQIKKNTPIIHISVKYQTSLPDYFIYSRLFCQTDRFPIGNSYFLKK